MSESKAGFPFGIGVSTHQGYLWPHRPDLMHLDGNYPRIYQIDLYKNTSGHLSWHHKYDFPKTGFSFFYSDIQTPVIGHMIGAGFFMEPKIFSSQRHELAFRVGTGIGYVSNPYDKESNPDNHMHGSHFNGMMQGILKYTYHLSPHLDLTTGISLTHLSNGVVKIPNRGSNIPAFMIGLDYRFHERTYRQKAEDTLDYLPGEYSFHVHIGGNFKAVNRPLEGSYPVGSLNLYASKRLNYKHSLLGGMNYFHDFVTSLDEQELENEEKIKDYSRLALTIGHELHISKVSFQSQIGFYVHHDHPFDNFMVQRVGLKYYVTPSFFGKYSLVTHFGKADYIEFAVGYRF